MCAAATSTTRPSGNFRPSLMMVFKSEPSGFADKTRPAPRSRKNSRPDVVDLSTPVYPFVATVRLLLNFYLQPRIFVGFFSLASGCTFDSFFHCREHRRGSMMVHDEARAPFAGHIGPNPLQEDA